MFKNSPQSRFWIGLAGFFIAALFALASFAQSVQSVPALTARVIDQTGTLTSEDIASLSSKLQEIEDKRGAQVVVLIVASTQPEDIFSYSNRVANTWKIGRKAIGDGVLIVVAKNDRKLRIEIAKSLEGAIPDVLAGQIISEFITPKFKQNQYASGLAAGIEQIGARIAGEALPAPVRKQTQSQGQNLPFDPLQMLLLAIFALPILGGIARKIFGNVLGLSLVGAGAGGLGWLLTSSLLVASGAGFIAIIITLIASIKGVGSGYHSGSGWTSGGSSGGFSGSGGFSSGGGGNFGGGGASGDW